MFVLTVLPSPGWNKIPNGFPFQGCELVVAAHVGLPDVFVVPSLISTALEISHAVLHPLK